MKLKFIMIFLIFISFSSISFSKELEIWTSWVESEMEVLIGLVSKYEYLTNKKIKIRNVPFSALNGRFMATVPLDKGPDIILGPSDWIGQFLVDDLIIPIDDVLKTIDKEDFLDNAIKSCTYNKKLYGLPESFKTLALFYNTDLIKTPPKTTKELISIGKKFTEIEKNKYGLIYTFPALYYHAPWIGSFGGNLLDENNNPMYNSSSFIDSFNFILTLTKGKDQIMPEEADEDMAISLFLDKEIPMIITGSWQLDKLIKSDINFAVTRIPMVNQTAQWAKPLLGTDILMISSKSKNINESKEFIKFLTSAESQLETALVGHLPSRKSVYEFKKLKNSIFFKYINAFKRQSEVAMPFPNSPELFIGVWPNGKCIKSIIYENRSSKEVFEEAQKKAIKLIDKFRQNSK